MKKHSALFLLLILSNTLSPLTPQDWAVIKRFRIGGKVTGWVGGAITGYMLGDAIGQRILPPEPPAPTNPAQAGVFHAKGGIAGLRRRHWIRSAPSIVLSSVGAHYGEKAGLTTSTQLAIMYIARKYRLSYKEAYNAILLDLDLSERLKK